MNNNDEKFVSFLVPGVAFVAKRPIFGWSNSHLDSDSYEVLDVGDIALVMDVSQKGHSVVSMSFFHKGDVFHAFVGPEHVGGL